MQPGPPRRRFPRPVADAPIDALLLRAEDLAKGWLLALVEDAPLAQAPAILAAELAREGPRLCEAVVRAMADDVALQRIALGGALEALVADAGELAGAASAEAAMRAVGALQAVIWSAVFDELSGPGPDQVAHLAERLWLVFEQVRGAALRGGRPDSDEPSVGRLWRRTVEDEVVAAERVGIPLAVLLVELEEADRILAVEAPSEASATFARFGRAVRSAIRGEGILARESEARAWVIAREMGAAEAQALGSRIEAAVAAAGPWRGAPLSVSIGAAALGEDGKDADALIVSAEEASFAAAAGGARVVDRGSRE